MGPSCPPTTKVRDLVLLETPLAAGDDHAQHVGKVRELPLTRWIVSDVAASLWEDEVKLAPGEKLEPFIVGRSRLGGELIAEPAGDEGDDFGGEYALVDMLVLMEYRIQSGDADGDSGLLRYLRFGTDQVARRQNLTEREQGLRDLALGHRYMATRSLDDVLSDERAEISGALEKLIQKRFDRLAVGVELLSVNIPMIRPSGDAAKDFQDLPLAVQQRDQLVANAERNRITLYTAIVGDTNGVEDIVSAIDRTNDACQRSTRRVRARIARRGGPPSGSPDRRGGAAASAGRWFSRLPDPVGRTRPLDRDQGKAGRRTGSRARSLPTRLRPLYRQR